MLIYPNNDVKDYLALSWASECVSDQWLVFDKMFKQRKEEIGRMRRQGLKVVDVTAEKCYIETVEQMAKDKDPFAAAVVNSCARFDETGFTKLANKWDDYIEALTNKIEMENSSGQDELDSAIEKITVAMNELTPENNTGLLKTGDDTWEAYINTEVDEDNNRIAKEVTKVIDGVSVAAFVRQDMTTPDTGRLIILGLEAGSYYMKETRPPEGYNQLAAAVEVKVAVEGSTAGRVVVNGVETIVYTARIVNNQGVELPSTGGKGTMMLITIGTLVTVAFAVLMITQKKMSVYHD
jgi:LPXTG-motif cell wall-anchored protein